MSKAVKKPLPGQRHLIPEDAWEIRTTQQGATTNWAEIKTYDGHEDWSVHRWAWEFLRRNWFFQQDCETADEAKRGRNRKKALPSHWYLQGYKSYTEPFERGNDILPPQWSVFSRVEVWDTNTPHRLKGERKPWHVENFTLQPGQIALVLDLNGTELLPELLGLQIKSAVYKAVRSAHRLREAEFKKRGQSQDQTQQPIGTRKKQKSVSQPRKDKLIDYLRIADAFSARFPAKLEEVCELLHKEGRLWPSGENPKRKNEFSIEKAKNSLYPMIAAARSLVYDGGYLLLLQPQAKTANWKEVHASAWPMVSSAKSEGAFKPSVPTETTETTELALTVEIFGGLLRQKPRNSK